MYFKKSIDFLKHETFGIVIFYETKPVFLGLSGMQHVLWADQFETSTSPPPGIPRAFDSVSRPGRGEFERCIERVGNLNRIYLLSWRNTPASFFGLYRVWRIHKIEFRFG